MISWMISTVFWIQNSSVTPNGCGLRDESQRGHPGIHPEDEEHLLSGIDEEECSFSNHHRMVEETTNEPTGFWFSCTDHKYI